MGSTLPGSVIFGERIFFEFRLNKNHRKIGVEFCRCEMRLFRLLN
jgi:hypothetical protein